MEKRLILLGALGLVLAAAPARAQGTSGQIELEGYLFTIRDLPGMTTDSSEEARSLELHGPGLRVHAWLGPGGGADRFEATFQRVADSARADLTPALASATGSATFDLSDAATSLDVTWSHALTDAGGGSTLRSQVGYRYLHRQRSLTSEFEVLNSPDCCSGSEQTRASLDGHGLRLGLEVGHDLGRHLRFEASGGAALAAAQDETTSVSQYIYIGGVMREELTETTRRGLVSWDLAAKLRGTWGPASLTVGYRFDRWEVTREPLSFDGLTVGVAYRFGKGSTTGVGPAAPQG